MTPDPGFVSPRRLRELERDVGMLRLALVTLAAEGERYAELSKTAAAWAGKLEDDVHAAVELLRDELTELRTALELFADAVEPVLDAIELVREAARPILNAEQPDAGILRLLQDRRAGLQDTLAGIAGEA